MHGISHDQWRFSRIDDNDGFALAGTADFGHRLGGGAGELINVLPGAGSHRFGADGGNDFSVLHRLHPGYGIDHGNGGLAATGHHVDVHFQGFGMLGQVHRGHAKRANGRRRQVHHDHPQGVQGLGIFRMDVSRGGVESNAHIVFNYRGQCTFNARHRGFQTHVPGPFYAL